MRAAEHILVTDELNNSKRGKRLEGSTLPSYATESGKVSLKKEDECLPLALLDRTTISVATDFCRENKFFVIQNSQVWRVCAESLASCLEQIVCKTFLAELVIYQHVILST